MVIERAAPAVRFACPFRTLESDGDAGDATTYVAHEPMRGVPGLLGAPPGQRGEVFTALA